MTSTRATRRRWWSVYLADGTHLTDIQATAAVIRATLPGAVVDALFSRVTVLSGEVRTPGEDRSTRVVRRGESGPKIDTD